MNTVIDSLISVDVDVDEDVNEPDTPLDISDLGDLDDNMQNDQNVVNVKKKLIQNRKLQDFEQRKKRK